MQTIIQVIETQWTKQSRGAAEAQKRNAVPEMVVIPDFSLALPAVLHHVVFSEKAGFVPCSTAGVCGYSAEDALRWRVEAEIAEGGSKLQFFGIPSAPTSGRAEYSVLLKANTWVQIVGNRRIAEDTSWGYRKFIYNIVHAHPADANTLLRSTRPIARLNYERQLW